MGFNSFDFDIKNTQSNTVDKITIRFTSGKRNLFLKCPLKWNPWLSASFPLLLSVQCDQVESLSRNCINSVHSSLSRNTGWVIQLYDNYTIIMQTFNKEYLLRPNFHLQPIFEAISFHSNIEGLH